MSTDAPPPPTPESLFARWQSERDPAALGALFDGAAPGLFRLALTLVPDAATAEDALQETFLFAMEEADRWDPARPVVPWLAGILRNKVLEVRRRNARAPRPERVPPPPTPDDPLLNAATAEERERVRVALLALEEPYREAALLRWRYGLEPAEIAEVKGVPPGTVSSWLHRAVEKLRVEMGALPAVMAVAFPERGLVGVKAAVLKSATAQALATTAAVGGGTAAALTLGGLAMANKVAVAAVVLVAVAAGGWIATRPAGSPAPSKPGPIVARGDTPIRPPAPTPMPEPAAAEPEEALPPAVDLSRCDRNLDLFGIVVDVGGKPVPGAGVRTLHRPWRRLAPSGFPVSEEFKDGPSTLTAADGTFSLRLERLAVTDLIVGKPGFAEALVPSCSAGEKVRVVLERGTLLEVRVLDAEGKGVPGALVRIQRKPGGAGTTATAVVPTDAEGRGLLKGLSSGPAILEVSCTGWGGALSRLLQIPDSGSIREEFVLTASKPVTGRVTDAATGEPIPGSKVGLAGHLEEAVAADADGAYRFPSWPRAGQNHLAAEAPGYGRMKELVKPGGTADFHLSPADTVTGRILDRRGVPAAGAKLFLLGFLLHPNGEQLQADAIHAAPGEDGTFSIPGVNHGWAHTLYVVAEGHGRLLVELPKPEGPVGRIDLGDIPLPEGRTIRGVLEDGAGVLIAGTEVRLRLMTPTSLPFPVTDRVRTDDLGRFRFPDLSAGEYRLFAVVAGSPPAEKDVTVPADADPAEVRLQTAGARAALGTVEVQILDPEGKPVSGVFVNAILAAGGASQKRTDGRGRATLTDLPGATVKLQISVLGTPEKPTRLLSPPPIEAAVGGPIVVVRLAAASLIRGKVVAPDGSPLARMSVNAKGPENAWAGSQTDGKGEFTLAVAGGVPFTVEVSGWRTSDDLRRMEMSNFRAAPQELTAPVDGIIYSMHTVVGGKTLTLRVLTPEGSPVPFCSISAPNQQAGPLPYTDKDGRVTLENLFEEESRILVHEPGGQVGVPSLPAGLIAPAPIRVIPRDQEITLTLRKGEPRTGRVLDPEGKPCHNAGVTLQTDDYVASTGWSDAEGRFTVWTSPGGKLIRAGAYTMSRSPDDPQFSVQFDESVFPGSVPQEGEIVLRLAPVKDPRRR